MIESKEIFDTLKVRFYYEWLVNNHVYDEGESGFHKEITTKMVQDYIDPLNLPKDANIIDLGCGPGYFLDEMKSRGYTKTVGVTLSAGDIKLCESKGHTIKKYDLSFLPVQDGYTDESVDLIFLRHALEHSPFPIFSLMEYNRVLKQRSALYIEVPQPSCARKHEFNPNHYSIFGAEMLAGLLQRTGFTIEKFNNFEFDLHMGTNESGEPNKVREKFYCVLARKTHSLDLK